MGKIDFFADDDNIVVSEPTESNDVDSTPATDNPPIASPVQNTVAEEQAEKSAYVYNNPNPPVKSNHKYNIMDVDNDSKKKYSKYKKKHKKKLALFASTLLFLLMCAIVIIGLLWIDLGVKKSDLANYKKQNKELSSQNVELVSENESYKTRIEAENKIAAGQALENSDKTVYLTFDDGPSENTPKILDVLDKYGVKATFFVINGKYNHYMKDIVDRGHTIALHSYTHNYAKIYKSEKAYFEDLKKISNLVKEQTGVDAKIARFPGGTNNTVSARYCEGIMTKLKKSTTARGYYYFDWNVDSTDASGNNVPVDKIIRYGSAGTKYTGDTAIVLMHDTNVKDTTVDALPTIIENYQKAGFNFAAINPLTRPIVFKVNN